MTRKRQIMKYECFKNDCYNLYTIKTDKFKTSQMEIVFQNRCDKETLTYLAFLFDYLTECNKSYPSKKLFGRKLEELYASSIYSVNSRIGNVLLTNLVVSFLDPKYMETDELENIIALAFDVIFNPNFETEEADELIFERIKTRLLKEIDSVKENPKQMSILSALTELDPNSPRSFKACGDAEVIESMTPKKLYKFYKKVIENSKVDIYVIGNFDMERVNKLVNKYSKFRAINTTKHKFFLEDIDKKKAISLEEENTQTQTNLVQLYAVKNLSDYERDYCMPIFNMIWGSASLESKLYKKVRGENSLCYNINTMYQKYDKLLVLHTAIDKENVSKTLNLIKSCLSDMKNGKITEEELANIKMMLINSLNLIYDSPGRLLDNYLFKNLIGLASIESRIEEFNKVTVDDLVKLSKKINLVLTYRMGG